MRSFGTGLAKLTGHQQRRLHHFHEIGHGRDDELLLLVGGGVEAGEEGRYVMQVGAQLGVGRYAVRRRDTAPEAIARANDGVAQQIASAPCFRSVLLEREVELQNQRSQRLRFGVLIGVDAIARPDEQAEHQGQQQGDETDDRADHALGVGDMLNRQQPLEQGAEEPARKGQRGHDQASGERIQAFASPGKGSSTPEPPIRRPRRRA